jgi:hypothetical protein
MTVWGVTVGEHSDYSVVCVCKSKDVADEVARRMSLGWQNNPQYRKPPHLYRHSVEEFDFVESAEEYVPTPGGGAPDPEAT